MEHTIKGLIFDYGGTIDSRGEHWSHVIERGYHKAGLSIDNVLFRQAYVEGERALARHPLVKPHHTFLDIMLLKVHIELQHLSSLGALPDGADIDSLTRAIATYCYDYARECVDEARPTLELLHTHFPMVMVSNFYGNLNAVLADFGIDHLFSSVIESAVVGVRKPSPAIFTLGVEALNLSAEQCAVIGDSLDKDILPAQSIGCPTFWLKGRGWTDDDTTSSQPHFFTLKEIAHALLT